ncbi:MAG: HAD family hydrolase [Cellvibrionaceae bacterium]|nr:HAD family hydrolase [Cellvibrionaceae bacterium]
MQDWVARELIIAADAKTPMYLAVDRKFAGLIAVADPIKGVDSAAAVERLRGLGIRVVMLTGDNRATAESDSPGRWVLKNLSASAAGIQSGKKSPLCNVRASWWA